MTLLERPARRLVVVWIIATTAVAFAASPTQSTITAFRANPEPALAGTPTTYAWTLTGTSNAVACTLDPGDGTPTITISDCANDATPHHTYATPGTYTATLGLKGANLSTTAHVTVVDSRPTNAKAGTLIWKYQTGSFTSSTPALAPDGTIYFGSADRHIYALNPNGTLQWKVPTGTGTERQSGLVMAAPSIAANGTIYVPVTLDGLYALNPDGTLRWRAPLDTWQLRSVAIGKQGTIYLGSLHHFDAYQPNGHLTWSYHPPDTSFPTIEGAPAIASDGTIYIGSEDRYIYALNPNGTLKWRYRTGDRVVSSPAISKNGTIYIGSIDGALYALDPDGTLQWKFQTGRPFEDPPTIAPDGTIYTANDLGMLYAINPNGTMKWQHSIEDTHYTPPIPHVIKGSPTIGNNGTIYIGSDDGVLYAFHPDGSLVWTFHTGQQPPISDVTRTEIESTPVIAPNGTLYLTADDGAIYAIHVTATGLAHSAWPKFHYGNRNTGRAHRSLGADHKADADATQLMGLRGSGP